MAVFLFYLLNKRTMKKETRDASASVDASLASNSRIYKNSDNVKRVIGESIERRPGTSKAIQ